jgi:hypothetical protein
MNPSTVEPREDRLRVLWAQYREARPEQYEDVLDCDGRDEDNWMQCPDCFPDVTAPGDCYTVDASGQCCATCGGISMLRPPIVVPTEFEVRLMGIECLWRGPDCEEGE